MKRIIILAVINLVVFVLLRVISVLIAFTFFGIGAEEINEQLKKYTPKKVERFPGNDISRGMAVNRALSRLNEKAYGFFSNNCEHFKNFVHYGKQYSKQVDVAGTSLTATGGLMAIGGALASKKKTRNWGALLLIFGLGLKYLAERSNNSEN